MNNEPLYYRMYRISNKYNYDDLNDERCEILDACIDLVDYGYTIRIIAKNYEYSSTTLWRRIHNECKDLSPELYKRVCRQLKKNHLKGMGW